VGIVSKRDPFAAPEITIFGPGQAPFLTKVGLALRMKKLAYEIVEPQSADDFRRWNPETGLLPVIDIDGTRVADSSKILDFLDAQFPEPPLLARDPRVARAQRALEAWTGETFYYYWLRWLRAVFDMPSLLDQPTTGSGAAISDLARLGVLSRVREALAERTGELDFGRLEPEFEHRLDDLIGFLGARPFFHADRPSRADLTVVAFLHSLAEGHIPGGHRMLAERPALRALIERVHDAIGGG
jgi:glutathione S-transferase